MRRITLTIISACLLMASLMRAQSWLPERSGGVYYAYPVESSQNVHIPDGFDVFYISHYGRHGSRWLPDQHRYDWVMAQFDDDKNLTKAGRRLKKTLRKIVKDADGNAGQLTPLGASQHRGIARRMVEQFPRVFAGADTRISARSSTVARCRASMLAFCDELQKLCPALRVTPETDARHMSYLNHESAELKDLSARIRRQADIVPDRFIAQFFKDPGKVQQPLQLLSELHTIASDMQDVPLDVSL